MITALIIGILGTALMLKCLKMPSIKEPEDNYAKSVKIQTRRKNIKVIR